MPCMLALQTPLKAGVPEIVIWLVMIYRGILNSVAHFSGSEWAIHADSALY